ncbi:uncharacterized protein LOC125498703 [Beta vulgaris subsp. vulgaris]|uniref:uncharacterized protein LOC125498703 n=1 Tax=Beta vulgaris subsp. vulgaris TaxID=3555 RepID=UPI002036BB31|nr:uncharacterized protein LOC125498703 [Beta vulgaris subsp. vulgaris]
MKSDMFMVRFHNVDSKNQVLEAGPILYDRKPVIVKEWTPNVDITADSLKMVPTWIKLPNLPLQYWGQVALNKIVGVIGKPIRTDRATTQKDLLDYARGNMQTQLIIYECKPLMCSDCGGSIGHNMEQCRQKRVEVVKAKIIQQKKWVPKAQLKELNSNQIAPIKVPETLEVAKHVYGLATIAEESEEEGRQVNIEDDGHATLEMQQVDSRENGQEDVIQINKMKDMERRVTKESPAPSLVPNG